MNQNNHISQLFNINVNIDRDEMQYIYERPTLIESGASKYLRTISSNLISNRACLFGKYTYSAITSLAIVVKIPMLAIVSVGATYCLFVNNLYRNMYNYFSIKSQVYSYIYKMSTITLLNIMAGQASI